jgi:hypothetical protein
LGYNLGAAYIFAWDSRGFMEVALPEKIGYLRVWGKGLKTET